MRNILVNYDNLNEGNGSRVPDASYQREKAALTPTEGAVPGMEGPRKPKAIRGSRYSNPHYTRALKQPEAYTLCVTGTGTRQDYKTETDQPQYYEPEPLTQRN